MATQTVRDAIIPAIVMQFVASLPFAIVLDGGRLGRIYGFSILAFWTGILWMVVRSRGSFPNWAPDVIKYGWIPAVIIGMALMMLGESIWRSLGIGVE